MFEMIGSTYNDYPLRKNLCHAVKLPLSGTILKIKISVLKQKMNQNCDK